MELKINDLVIGRKYKINSKKWFEKKENEQFKYYRYHCDRIMILNEILNGNTLVFYDDYHYTSDSAYLGIEAVKEISGQQNPSKKIINAVKKLKKEKYIYGYDGGPGGGRGSTIDTVKEAILPAITESGIEKIYIKVGNCRRLFSAEEIDKLFEKGEVEQGFWATEYSYIKTELSLIKNKKNLPKESRWETMSD